MEKQVLRGSDAMLFVDGKAIALATSCSLEITTNTVDARTKDSAYGADTELDYISWTSSSESFIGANKDVTAEQLAGYLIDAQLAGKTVVLVLGVVSRSSAGVGANGWQTPSSSDNAALPTYTGNAWIKSVNVNHPNEGKSTVSVQFEGIGRLEKIEQL